MPVYHVRDEAASYGHALGLLLLPAPYPFIPGHPACAGSFRHPVLYEELPALDPSINSGETIPSGIVVAAAQRLAAQGVRAIGAADSRLAGFQGIVREAVDIPVCLSARLQLPLLSLSLPPDRPIAVLTGYGKADAPLAFPGVRQPLIHVSLGDGSAFKDAIDPGNGWLDTDALEAEVLQAVASAQRRYPALGAVLFDDAWLPPFAQAVQRAIGLPVADLMTGLNYLLASTHQRSHAGLY